MKHKEVEEPPAAEEEVVAAVNQVAAFPAEEDEPLVPDVLFSRRTRPPETRATPPHAEPEHATETAAPRAESLPSGGRRSPAGDILAALERLEQVLGRMRSALELRVREERHLEFSPARLIGAVVQALVVGLVLWALSDWVFAEPPVALLTKLAFAGVLQLGALTAFMLGREVP